MARSRLIPRVTGFVLCLLFFSCRSFQQASALTRTSDVTALAELSRAWPVTTSELNWGSGDPCGKPWIGVICDSTNATVTQLVLDFRNLVGVIPPGIGDLQNLQMLELSSNRALGGALPIELGKLLNLRILSLQYCGFFGSIPSAIGDLTQLTFLGLNGNNFSGVLPEELGKTNLTWMDISDNQFSGEIPVSRNSPNLLGLDNLTNIMHYHFENNSFVGDVPGEFFSMPNVQHVMLDHNRLNGTISSFQTLSAQLTVVRLDANQLSGTIPSAFESAAAVTDLNLKDNSFSGPLPNFTSIPTLSNLDLSNNKFDPQDLSPWVLSLPNIQTLNLAALGLSGEVPSALFNLPNIDAVDLSFNNLNSTLTFETVSSSLTEVNLTNNKIIGFSGNPPSTIDIILENNPICNNSFITVSTCSGNTNLLTWQHPPVQSNCSSKTNSACSGGKWLDVYTCVCAYPLELTLLLTAPSFSNGKDPALQLEQDLASNLKIDPNLIYVWDIVTLAVARVVVTVLVFPASGEGDSVPSSVGDNIILQLRHHTVSLPEGPYLLLNRVYTGATTNHHLSTGSIIAVIVGSAAGLAIVGISVILAVYHKRRADKAVMGNPFASWGGGSAEFGEAPKLKGARWFSLAELRAYTNNWSEDNQIGQGGYGKVYRGLLPNNDPVAIKRATEGSMQGANEFKNEIELLSRVHHRNLVGLVGFCYEGGEQALIYEFMSNGTLSDHLTGRGEEPLDWNMRLQIALESATGLSYLHDHASPPIIHRDIKSANILLNEKMVAKVADFGLSKLAPDEGQKLVYSVHVKGTLGYLDPEYYMTQNLTDKSDVYSFGVVLLELLTARPPIDGGKFVVREMRTALDKGGVASVRPLLDPAIKDISLKELDAYLKIALSCVEEAGEERPTISEVVKQLGGLDVFTRMKSGAHPGNVEGGKRVKFSDTVMESDDTDLSKKGNPANMTYPYQEASRDSFKYSGTFGISTTVRPK